MAIFELVIGAVIGFIIGVFVYRNNVDVISPLAKIIDAKYDILEAKIEELTKKLKEKNNI